LEKELIPTKQRGKEVGFAGKLSRGKRGQRKNMEWCVLRRVDVFKTNPLGESGSKRESMEVGSRNRVEEKGCLGRVGKVVPVGG